MRLEEENAALRAENAALKGELSALREQVNRLTAALAVAQARIAELEAKKMPSRRITPPRWKSWSGRRRSKRSTCWYKPGWLRASRASAPTQNWCCWCALWANSLPRPRAIPVRHWQSGGGVIRTNCSSLCARRACPLTTIWPSGACARWSSAARSVEGLAASRALPPT